MTANLRVVDAHYPADFERLRAVREPVFVIEQHCPIEEEWDALGTPIGACPGVERARQQNPWPHRAS